jgi:hypothetical protein
MRIGRLPSGLISLAAAYAVALQALLSAFAIPAGAAFHPGVLCSGESIERPDAPVRHEPSCTTACAMLNAAAAPPPPGIVVTVPFLRVISQSIPVTSPAVAPQRGPNAARAPPSV